MKTPRFLIAFDKNEHDEFRVVQSLYRAELRPLKSFEERAGADEIILEMQQDVGNALSPHYAVCRQENMCSHGASSQVFFFGEVLIIRKNAVPAGSSRSRDSAKKRIEKNPPRDSNSRQNLTP